MNRIYLVAVILLLVSLACSVRVPSSDLVAATSTVTATRHVVSTVTASLTATRLVWTAKVQQPTVNVRAAPSGRVIGSITVGKTVTIVQCDGSWCKISAPMAGYIFRGCLSDNPENKRCEAK